MSHRPCQEKNEMTLGELEVSDSQSYLLVELVSLIPRDVQIYLMIKYDHLWLAKTLEKAVLYKKSKKLNVDALFYTRWIDREKNPIIKDGSKTIKNP